MSDRSKCSDTRFLGGGLAAIILLCGVAYALPNKAEPQTPTSNTVNVVISPDAFVTEHPRNPDAICVVNPGYEVALCASEIIPGALKPLIDG